MILGGGGGWRGCQDWGELGILGGGKIIINSYVLHKILLGVFFMFLEDLIDEISRAGPP